MFSFKKNTLKLLLLFCTTTQLSAQHPKIALVLSGGGARGGAHVGVLKVLEKNHIPVDIIIGTSMGSLMGALYASGKSPEEIEEILLKTDWKRYIRTDFERESIPMQAKILQYRYQGRLGVGINDKGEVVLPTGVLKREPLLLAFDDFFSQTVNIKNFDQLPIAFRAVATNIQNGEMVVLKRGSLAEAVYASSAIPGGFQPIKIQNKVLVDGGISKNLPIEVAKEMGADIIIAVDVSEDFKSDVDVNSYLSVMKQLVDIMTRKNVNDSLKLLGSKDILIRPSLEKYSGLDVSHYKEIIAEGFKAALQQEKSLQKLSLSESEYKEYRQKHRLLNYRSEFLIQKIVIKNSTYLKESVIRQYISQKEGEPFDGEQLRQDIAKLYQMTIFDTIQYEIKKERGEESLVITLTPSWNSKGDILFSLALEDNFKAQNNYALKFGYWLYGLNSLGGEWRNDVEIGTKRSFYTEFYQPLNTLQSIYVRPYLHYEDITYSVPTDYGTQEIELRRYGGGFGLGANLSATFDIEAFLAAYKDRSVVNLLFYRENFRSKQLGLQMHFDSLDNYAFPNSGTFASLKVTKELQSLGSDYDYTQLYATIQKPFSYKKNSFVLNAKIGLSDMAKNQQGFRIYDKFWLGGMFNLSGYPSYSLLQNNMFFGSIMYRYRLKNGGFFGSLGMPVYAGFTAESGAAWSREDGFKKEDVKYAGSLYISSDTPFGPFYFTYGYADKKRQSFYLYLGEKF